MLELGLASVSDLLKDNKEAFEKFNAQFKPGKVLFSKQLQNHPKVLFDVIDIYNRNLGVLQHHLRLIIFMLGLIKKNHLALQDAVAFLTNCQDQLLAIWATNPALCSERFVLYLPPNNKVEYCFSNCTSRHFFASKLPVFSFLPPSSLLRDSFGNFRTRMGRVSSEV